MFSVYPLGFVTVAVFSRCVCNKCIWNQSIDGRCTLCCLVYVCGRLTGCGGRLSSADSNHLAFVSVPAPAKVPLLLPALATYPASDATVM